MPAHDNLTLHARCLQLLEARSGAQDWQQFMCWVAGRHFNDAKREGWLDAILIQAHSDPWAIRTMEYADHCDEVWDSQIPDPYPSFEGWRNAVDSYVEPPSVLPKAPDS